MSTALQHIAGSTFGLTISTDQCPIVDPSGDPIDTAGWSVSVRLIGEKMRLDLPGEWLSSAGPWVISFASTDTLAWPPGIHVCRLLYVEPAPGARRFEVGTDLQVEVVR
jgi:hypothetical protein